MNKLPLEIVDNILKYDGRIKYRKGEFVNVIDPKLFGFYRVILDPIINKKRKFYQRLIQHVLDIILICLKIVIYYLIQNVFILNLNLPVYIMLDCVMIIIGDLISLKYVILI